MDYVINDIEDMIIQNRFGLFCIISSKCNSISLTNIKISDFSKLKEFDIQLLQSNGLTVVEVDIEMFYFKKRHSLLAFGKGDVSSIYQAFITNSCLITSNRSVYSKCIELSIQVIYLDEFMKLIFGDSSKLKRINKLKLIYKRNIKDII
ncbi:hypothetical protein KCTC32516_00548 [Polaribacter huanghezhanensis]|uniref:hypothetical protein n=1 Tax=Polaribacter huanghezhanensis TaxID=1354726 RepID=UPI0026472AD5|nr:hypothetical protein [Polaribacter huanghezhanensis]WKD85208.1 hypothetical protein KCTC32516_00548 [Polaribacter huanghezhanensis]